MVAVTEDLDTMFKAVNSEENPITTMIVTERNGEKGMEREYEITFKAGLVEAYSQQGLENAYNAPAVGPSDATVQLLNDQFYGNAPAMPAATSNEISAQAAAAETVTDTLDMHLQHTQQTVAGVAAEGNLTDKTLEQLAAVAPTAPQVHVAEGLEVQVVQQMNQPPVVAVSFDPITDGDPKKIEAQLEKIEGQLLGLAEQKGVLPDGINIANVIAEIKKQQYPELLQTGDIELTPPPIPAEAQGLASIETPDVRRRPQEAAQASEQLITQSNALPQVSALQYEGMAVPAQQQARISASDITAVTR